ncbi:MAG: hypothetical protein EAX86_12425 [Candidatus Heimdallarchaeota archaeon]|nr:hypothetical protein [Candidatus Heimdallarchaeota archaeon]
MEIFPLAAESLGSRGMCVVVKTQDQQILIDPSVSLGPLRYGLKPHLKEIAAAYLSRQLILEAVKRSTIIIQTHYHGDHYTLGIERPYEFTDHKIQEQVYNHPNIIILAKDHKKKINYNQKKRAHWLWEKNVKIYSADANKFLYGKTQITFSPPLPHGATGSQSGWVISVFIEDLESSVLLTSDVHGPSNDAALEFILENNPKHLILDGPSTYHPKQMQEETEAAFRRLHQLPHEHYYLDHHFLRDRNWPGILEEQNLTKKAFPLSSLVINTPLCLESRRDELHAMEPMKGQYQDFYSLFEEKNEAILSIIKDRASTLPFAFLKQGL